LQALRQQNDDEFMSEQQNDEFDYLTDPELREAMRRTMLDK
jgi:hypothetical protein